MKSWKTSVCGILGALCAALAIIGEMPAVWSKVFTALGPFFGSLGLLFARDNGVTSEQAGAAPIKASGINLSILMVCAALAVGASGCTTTSSGTRVVDVQRVARLAGVAADVGSRVYIQHHPADRALFVVTEAALADLDSRGDYDPVKFAAALQTLPIKALTGPDGSLLIGVALVAWDELSALSEPLTTKEWVQPVLQKVRDGLARAIAATNPAP